MADNYLEKRMEELRSGKLGATPRPNATNSIANKIQFSFPPKRIIIFDPIMPEGYDIGTAFQRIGCKVSFVCSDECEISSEYVEKIKNEGFIIFSLANDYENKMKSILAKWRGADILINFSSKLIPQSLQIIENYLIEKPSPSNYKRRLITISDDSKKEDSYSILQFTIPYKRAYGSTNELLRMVQFLSLPEAEKIKTGLR